MHLEEQDGAQPQLHADNLECVSRISGVLFDAAGFATGYVKYVLLSMSRATRADMKNWIFSLRKVIKGTVTLDIRDLGGDLDTTCRRWAATLATRVRLVFQRLRLLAARPLDFWKRSRVVRTLLIARALYGIEASSLCQSCLVRLRSALVNVVWSRRKLLAHGRSVLSSLDGPEGCDPGFLCSLVWVP